MDLRGRVLELLMVKSIEDELDRETYMDIAIIALSYILMFVYITFSLGRITTMKRFLVSNLGMFKEFWLLYLT